MKTLKELCSKFFNILETDSIQSYAEATGDIFCFRRALEKFLNTGRKEDAFTVYFCFSEIFKLFGTGYDNTKNSLKLFRTTNIIRENFLPNTETIIPIPFTFLR